MDRFWPEAAKVVKPGGTVALWTCGELFQKACSEHILISVQRLRFVASILRLRMILAKSNYHFRSRYAKLCESQ